MGSRSTKVAAPPHVKAAASPVALAGEHHEKRNYTNEVGPCQDVHQAAREIVIPRQPCDDFNLRFPTRTITASTRRYSEPAQAVVMATELNTEGIRHLDASERFLTERELMAIDVDYAALTTPIPIEQLPIPPLFGSVKKDAKEAQEPEIQCIGCCMQLPKEKDPAYVREVIKPCRLCNSAYCISCVKGMFLNACRDSTRMPPRCCTQIHLHHIKPHLTAEEIAGYKSRYEEWSTPKPFYCPVPTCSTFIPERLLPQQAETESKRKVDSGIGTPTSPNFQCPRCAGAICVDCRQMAHPDSLCATLELGIDADTAALLKAWGYKRCPKCSQGLKRMYGCNHMECRCGAHFCWGCMKSRDECEGGCYEDEDEDEASDSEPDEPEPLPGSDDDTAMRTQNATIEATEPVTQTMESDLTVTATTSEPAPRSRNLDGGAAHYWEQQDLDFGDEPTDDVQDRVWECRHKFEPYTISLTEAISIHPSMHEMECVKCWRAIQPDIRTPPKSVTAAEPTKAARSSTGRYRGDGGRGGRGGGRGMVARLRPAAYVPPRGLVRSDTTIGTALHLTAPLLPVARQPSEARSDSMEDIRSDLQAERRFPIIPPTSNVFGDPSTTYSIAQECHSCSLLVCKSCADAVLVQREVKRETRAAERETEETEIEAQESTEVPASPGHDGHSPPSLFD